MINCRGSVTILQVSNAHFPAVVYGGPIFSVHYTCQALARQGLQINVATTNANGRSKLDVPTNKEVVFEPNYVVRYYKDSANGRFSWAFTLNVWRDVKQAAVVHLQDIFSPHASATLILAMLFRKPVLISPRGVFSSWALTARKRRLKQVLLSLFIRPFVRNTRRVAWHATSIQERDEIRSLFPNNCVFVAPNGIDCTAFDRDTGFNRQQYLNRFFPNCRAEPDKVKILVSMGRLHRKKSFDVAINALRLTRAKFPEAMLMIAGGDNGERKALEGMIASCGLQGYASLVGEVYDDDKVAFLKGADLFLFPSHSENFGMAALEALAAGLPVIASRNTPFQEIEAAGCGCWVDNTAAAFAAAIDQMLMNDLADMREKARTYARRYDIGRVASLLKKIYMDLIDGNIQ